MSLCVYVCVGVSDVKESFADARLYTYKLQLYSYRRRNLNFISLRGVRDSYLCRFWPHRKLDLKSHWDIAFATLNTYLIVHNDIGVYNYYFLPERYIEFSTICDEEKMNNKFW